MRNHRVQQDLRGVISISKVDVSCYMFSVTVYEGGALGAKRLSFFLFYHDLIDIVKF